MPDLTSGRCFELVARHVPSPSDFGPDWPLEPGSVRLATSGAAGLLHFAPGRWLMPEPEEALLQHAAGIAAAEAAELIDVEGKWQCITLADANGVRALSAGVAVEAVLQGRNCAALALFDCPAVLVQRVDAFDLWVLSSYARSLVRSIESSAMRKQSFSPCRP